MPRIHCLYVDCTFIDANYCTAPIVEIDPDMGCATYVPIGTEDLLSDEWESDDEDEYDDWETEDLDKDDDDEDFSEDDEDDW